MTTTIARSLARRVVSLAAAIAVMIGVAVARPVANTDNPAGLRCDRTLTRLAQQGLARSATLRALVAELERAHVIAYATISRELPPGVGGRVRFIGAGDGWRFVQIDLDDRRSKVELLSMLGHELQHAAEIANSPEVVDTASMAELYDRIGIPHQTGRALENIGYETQAAMDVERRVFGELFGDHW